MRTQISFLNVFKRVIIRWLPLMLILGFIFAMCGFFYARAIYVPQYSAATSVKIYHTIKPVKKAHKTKHEYRRAVKKAKRSQHKKDIKKMDHYAELVTDNRNLKIAVKRLKHKHVNITFNKLKRTVSALPKQNDDALTVSATTNRPSKTVKIVNTVAAVFTERYQHTKPRLHVIHFDKAKQASINTPQIKYYMIRGTVFGIVLGYILAIIISVRRTNRK